ncbi:MAG: ComF family protein [Gammaproteobacteria bacterium]|nr:ComF family protein [Gammaproteobacteria bacterium]MCF6364565.1 ComF family protein [Gammaproteobacteria bacterium]
MLCGERGASGLDLCHACRLDLPIIEAACARCAIPLPVAHQHGSLCGQCQTEPPAFTHCLAPFAYHAPLDHLLKDLKFNRRLVLARTLGGLMAQWLEGRTDGLPERIIPVPLHPARLRERGFNQSLELARPIARRLKLPLDTHSCRRLRNTPPQAELPAEQRHNNLKGAFGVRQKLAGRVAIIDDVMTTGYTVQELARTLRDAGAAQVDVWVCARAGRI